MRSICAYAGRTPMDNSMCNRCSLFLECCVPVAARDGYGLGSEMDCYLCEGCNRDCVNENTVTLYGNYKNIWRLEQ